MEADGNAHDKGVEKIREDLNVIAANSSYFADSGNNLDGIQPDLDETKYLTPGKSPFKSPLTPIVDTEPKTPEERSESKASGEPSEGVTKGDDDPDHFEIRRPAAREENHENSITERTETFEQPLNRITRSASKKLAIETANLAHESSDEDSSNNDEDPKQETIKDSKKSSKKKKKSPRGSGNKSRNNNKSRRRRGNRFEK
jgi:hypothetical protein